MKTKIYPIDPCPKPRMTKKDCRRPVHKRYWQWKADVQKLGVHVPEWGYWVIFHIPMPKSWSKKKKAQMNGMAHQQRPDKDNLEKGLLDAIYGEDCRVWDGRVTKLWAEEGAIEVRCG